LGKYSAKGIVVILNLYSYCANQENKIKHKTDISHGGYLFQITDKFRHPKVHRIFKAPGVILVQDRCPALRTSCN